MGIYHSKYNQVASTSHARVVTLARVEYHAIQKLTPRREVYVRSKYFKGEKVFINQFWEHLKQKRRSDAVRRLRLFSPGLDLIRNSSFMPATVNKGSSTYLHRFSGITRNGLEYSVQIRENTRTNRKDFMSVFPVGLNKGK